MKRVLAVGCVLMFVGCAGFLGLGAMIASRLPPPPSVERPVAAPVRPVEATADAEADYLAIVALPPGDERERRLAAWAAQHPDLMENMRRNIAAAAAQEDTAPAKEQVSGYTKKNGTVVAPYTRRPK